VNHPVASLSVTYDDVHDLYVMVYSPWPGFTDRVIVRAAVSPEGPWTPPMEVVLPGCVDSVGGRGFYCYAGSAQPQFSSPGLLGVGYYDQLIALSPERGGYLVVTVPFNVLLPTP
ncbi:MAG TPA: hypothetical protein VJM33_18350, partial [Microthrixaceae bacterium]|nr:hypothetical protein [Microthrixaceae bacterium]